MPSDFRFHMNNLNLYSGKADFWKNMSTSTYRKESERERERLKSIIAFFPFEFIMCIQLADRICMVVVSESMHNSQFSLYCIRIDILIHAFECYAIVCCHSQMTQVNELLNAHWLLARAHYRLYNISVVQATISGSEQKLIYFACKIVAGSVLLIKW